MQSWHFILENLYRLTTYNVVISGCSCLCHCSCIAVSVVFKVKCVISNFYHNYFTNISYFHARPKKFPPGPTNIPLVGSLLNVDVRNLSKSLSKLSKKYGDVYSLFVGRTPVVCLNSFETIKKCFEKNEFSGKNLMNHSMYLLTNDFLIARTSGELLRDIFPERKDWNIYHGGKVLEVSEGVSDQPS